MIWRKHVHDLHPVAVSHVSQPLGPQLTNVLFRCDCLSGPGSLKGVSIPGRWSLEDITGMSDPRDSSDRVMTPEGRRSR